MIAALYVQRDGAYYGHKDVDPWDQERDARLYAGPWSVVAHPPCARWSRLADLVASKGGRAVGDDDGCFAAALASVRKWGGVLEHPAWTKAWKAFGLATPRRGWSLPDRFGGRVCAVSQAAYGHRAPKETWLYYVGASPPDLDWSRPDDPGAPWIECRDGCGEFWCTIHQEHVYECACPPMDERNESPYTSSKTSKGRPRGQVETQTKAERAATPPAFRDMLIDLAHYARRTS